MTDFTTYIAVDAGHLAELRLSIETWRKYRPEIWLHPLVVIRDGDLDLSFVNHSEMSIVDALPGPFATQREKMLTSLTLIPATAQTPWYLKLDTDSLATRHGNWIEEGWFLNNCLVASPWSYTKPAEMMRQMDAWGNDHPAIGNYPPPPRTYSGDIAKCKRIISFVMFGRTDWTADVVSMLDGPRLPCPSQDTFLWYCADRLRTRYQRVRMQHFGWVHCGSNYRRMRQLCQLESAI